MELPPALRSDCGSVSTPPRLGLAAPGSSGTRSRRLACRSQFSLRERRVGRPDNQGTGTLPRGVTGQAPPPPGGVLFWGPRKHRTTKILTVAKIQHLELIPPLTFEFRRGYFADAKNPQHETPMRLPCPLRNFKHPVENPAPPFEQLTTALAFMALVGAGVAAIGIIIATQVR